MSYPAYPGYPGGQGGGQHHGHHHGGAGGFGGGYPGQSAQMANFPKREFLIVSEMHGKVLDIEKENANSGAKVIMWNKHKEKEHKKNQLWYLDQRGFIHSALNDMVLHNSEYGKEITTAPYQENPRYQFKFEGKKITNGVGECLDIKGKDDDKGAVVITYEYKDQKNQQWNQEYTE